MIDNHNPCFVPLQITMVLFGKPQLRLRSQPASRRHARLPANIVGHPANGATFVVAVVVHSFCHLLHEPRGANRNTSVVLMWRLANLAEWGAEPVPALWSVPGRIAQQQGRVVRVGGCSGGTTTCTLVRRIILIRVVVVCDTAAFRRGRGGGRKAQPVPHPMGQGRQSAID